MRDSIINLSLFNSGQSTGTRYCICYWRCNRLCQRERASMGISEEKLGTTSGEIWRRIFIVSTCKGKHYISLEKISCSFIFSSPCQRQCELLPSLSLTFYILIFTQCGKLLLTNSPNASVKWFWRVFLSKY